MNRERNNDKPWLHDNCRRAFDLKQEVHLRLTRNDSRVNWDQFVHYRRIANEIYAEAGRQYCVRNNDVLVNAHCPVSL